MPSFILYLTLSILCCFKSDETTKEKKTAPLWLLLCVIFCIMALSSLFEVLAH